MREVAQRELGDGSRTTITLYLVDDDTCVIEAVNVNGTSSGECPASDATDWYWHPFCNEFRLDYPTPALTRATRQRNLTPAEYALAEALSEAVTE